MSVTSEQLFVENNFPFPHIIYVYILCLGLSFFVHGTAYAVTTLTQLSLIQGLAKPLTLLVLTFLPDLWLHPNTFGRLFSIRAGTKSIVTTWALIILIKNLLEAHKNGFTKKEVFKPCSTHNIVKLCTNAIVLSNLMFPASFVLTVVSKFTSLKMGEFFGIGLWIYGMTIFITSTLQKFFFKKKSPGDFVTTGLWKYCRYPDLHGELVMWLGLFVVTSLKLNIFCTLLMFLVSPLLCLINVYFLEGGVKSKDKSAEDKYGHRQDYILYKHGTYSILPKLKSADSQKPLS